MVTRALRAKLLYAAVVVVLGSAVAAHAHKPRPTREMVLQIDDAGVAALWRVEVTGRDAQLAVALHDLDRGGSLSESEGRAAATAILGKALQRVGLRWTAAPLALVRFEARLEATGSALAAVGLVEMARPPGVVDGTLSVVVAGGDIAIDVQALAPWRLAGTSRGTLNSDERGLTEPLLLAAGERLEVRAQRVRQGP